MAENANPGGSIATLTQSPSGIPKDTLAKAVEGRLDAKRDSEQMADALDWLMEREADPDRAPEPKTLKLNLGTSDEPQWVRWVIVAVEDSKITAIREQSRKGGNRRQRRAGTLDAEIDEMQVARKMVVEGTVEPAMGALAKRLGLIDPADAVYEFFRKAGKTGLITQLSGEILSISGWDDEDLQEVDAARG
jgi:hypothetical protein